MEPKIGTVVFVEPVEDTTVPPIFTITCLYLNREDADRPYEHKRTWGWHPSLERAIRAVMDNETDMFERGYYNMAVIEERPAGTMAFARNGHWFDVKFVDPKTNTYEITPIPKPERLKHCGGWAW